MFNSNINDIITQTNKMKERQAMAFILNVLAYFFLIKYMLDTNTFHYLYIPLLLIGFVSTVTLTSFVLNLFPRLIKKNKQKAKIIRIFRSMDFEEQLFLKNFLWQMRNFIELDTDKKTEIAKSINKQFKVFKIDEQDKRAYMSIEMQEFLWHIGEKAGIF